MCLHLSTCLGWKKWNKIQMTQWIILHLHSSLTLEFVSYRHHGMRLFTHAVPLQQWEFLLCVSETKAFFFFKKADAMQLSVSPTAAFLCLATVVWNPHTSSGISMISEAGLVCTTDCSHYLLQRATCKRCSRLHYLIGHYPLLSVCAAVNEV